MRKGANKRAKAKRSSLAKLLAVKGWPRRAAAEAFAATLTAGAGLALRMTDPPGVFGLGCTGCALRRLFGCGLWPLLRFFT